MTLRGFARHTHLTLAAGLLGGVLGTAAPAAAQGTPTSVEAIANYQGSDRTKMLEEGARKEGNLLVYTTGTQIQPLIDRFKEKYPFITVELSRASSADTARKVVEEYAAGYYKVDAFELASHGLIVPRDQACCSPSPRPN
jgi:iron(III) transport system substrate-binding protein